MEEKICLNCNTPFLPKKNDIRIKFCCEKCRTDYRLKNGYMKDYYRVNNASWKRRQSEELYKEKKNAARRLKYATDDSYREKHKQAVKEYNKRKPEIKLNQRLKKFGITLNDYEQLLAKQNGKCAICGSEIGDIMNNRLYVDHDHQSGQVRGLLCAACNFGIGQFKDDIDLLTKAIKYLGG